MWLAKCLPPILALLNGLHVLAFHDAATQGQGCKDNGVWVFDGSVACKHLETASNWGLHTRAKYYCTEYPQTDCCETCTRLGFSGKPTSPSQPTSTQASSSSGPTSASIGPTTESPPTTSVSPTTTQPSPTTSQSSQSTTVSTSTTTPSSACVDEHIWMMDASIPCRYLWVPSHWGFHKDPMYYCDVYAQTKCCNTCRIIRQVWRIMGQPKIQVKTL